MSEEGEELAGLMAKQARIEARATHRVLETQDGKIMMEALKRDFGWNAAAPPSGKDGEISVARLRAWTGSRGVIATLLHKAEQGSKLTQNE